MENRRTIVTAAVFLCLNILGTHAQVYSLGELLRLGHLTTGEAIIESEKMMSEYDNRLFRIRTLPQMQLSATLPGLTHNISSVTMADGSEKFVDRFYMNSAISLSISQLVPYTGGTLHLSSGLTRLDNYSPQRNHSFNLNLFNFSYSQNVSPFNQYKWDKRLLDKQNEIFDLSQIQSREKVNLSIVEAFFDLLAAQKKEELNTAMQEYSTQIYERSKVLYSQGRISQSDLRDAEIALKQFAYSTVQNERIRRQKQLAAKLNLPEDSPSVYFEFEDLENIKLSYETEYVVGRVVQYSAEAQRELEQIEEGTSLEKQKASGLPSISVSVGGGYNAHNEVFGQLINAPSKSFSAILSIGIPILSWGENRYRVHRLMAQNRIAELKHDDYVKELIASTQYELDCLPLLLESVLAYKETLQLLYSQLREMTDLYDAGRISHVRIQDLQKDIIQTELSRIERARQLLYLQYKYRMTALYDIMANIPIV